jgi:hypothetical protein
LTPVIARAITGAVIRILKGKLEGLALRKEKLSFSCRGKGARGMGVAEVREQ